MSVFRDSAPRALFFFFLLFATLLLRVRSCECLYYWIPCSGSSDGVNQRLWTQSRDVGEWEPKVHPARPSDKKELTGSWFAPVLLLDCCCHLWAAMGIAAYFMKNVVIPNGPTLSLVSRETWLVAGWQWERKNTFFTHFLGNDMLNFRSRMRQMLLSILAEVQLVTDCLRSTFLG